MQINITLSNKEKRHYFLYLLGMLILTIAIISVISLRKFKSPYSEADVDSLEKLREKAKFDEGQKFTQLKMDSTFAKITRINPEVSDIVGSNEITLGINQITKTYENTSILDQRKEGYKTIGKFYSMYQFDKKDMEKTMENIKSNQAQLDACNINMKDKQRALQP